MDKFFYEHNRDFNNELYCLKKFNCAWNSHFHRNIELHYTLKGKIQITINDKTFIHQENDLALIPSYAIHSFKTLEKSECITYIIPHSYSNEFDQFFQSNCFDYPLKDKKFNKDVILPILELMLQNVNISRNMENDYFLKGLTTAIIGGILNNYKPTKLEKNSLNSIGNIVEVLDFVENNYNHDISLETISKKFGYNKEYFSKIFHKYVHTTLTDYINAVKVENVISKLKKNNFQNMLNTIYECGFNSPSTFYRAFQKRYDMSVKEYIKQNEI